MMNTQGIRIRFCVQNPYPKIHLDGKTKGLIVMFVDRIE